MAKKAKKKVSWRTLARRAEKAAGKNLPMARRLRAQAAELRRTERTKNRVSTVEGKIVPAKRRNLGAAKRAVKGWATRHANALKREVAAVRDPVGAELYGDNAKQATAQGLNAEYRPGHGELVGGSLSQLAERLTKLARKKGGKDEIQHELAALSATSKYVGQVETDKAATKRLVDIQKLTGDRIVCGFLSEIEHCMKVNRGLPPGMTHIIGSYTITKIMDALNRAGYSASGQTPDPQIVRNYDKETL